ncbi:helix-turn-helix domain-containing protein [Rhodococcus kronopolitis]|uniref:Helix-turn-helix domain-containing protein n=1 Tax=Rhodococcus kronopolitis TaxID=1460226 RepID=A0ABV9FUD9_9NOCA
MSIDHIVPALDGAAAARIRAALDAVPATAPVESEVVVDGVAIPVTGPAREAVLQLLTHLASGQGVGLGPVAELLTTSQAAEILGVSDTYVRRLADAQELPIEFRGTHRRFRLSELLAYRQRFPRSR